jgi:transposase
MHAGVAPLECSSEAWQRRRLSRVGNRQLNAALHRIAVTQLRVHPAAQAYLMRQRAAGKSKGRSRFPVSSCRFPGRSFVLLRDHLV